MTAWLVPVKPAGFKRGQKLFIDDATGAIGHAAIAIAREIGAEVTGRVGPQFIDQAQSLGLSLALDYTKPLSAMLDGSLDVVFDARGSLSIQEGDRLIKRGGKVFGIAPAKWKFLKALVSRSRKVVIADPKAENLQPVSISRRPASLRFLSFKPPPWCRLQRCWRRWSKANALTEKPSSRFPTKHEPDRP